MRDEEAAQSVERAVATDLMLYLDDQPGELANLGLALGRAEVNVEGFCAVSSGGGQSEVHVLVEDAAAAFDALAAAGIDVVSEQEVAVVDVEDRPGVLGEVSRKLGDAGVNITVAYLATSTRLVFGADNLALAKAALD
jgi:hypothetical protein